MTYPFPDRKLAQRIERADGAIQKAIAQTHRACLPESRAETLEVAGGQMIFVSPDSPLTQSFGLGFQETGEEALDQLETFFRERGCAVNLELSHLADISLFQRLSARGYTIDEHTVVCAAPIDPALAREPLPEGTHRAPEGGEHNSDAVVARSFCEGGDPPESLLELCRIFRKAGVTFFAERDGQTVAGGTLFVQDGIAFLLGTATLPDFRKRGCQTDLIQARLAKAAASGASLAVVITLPGTISQRNVFRRGMTPLYARTKMTRTW